VVNDYQPSCSGKPDQDFPFLKPETAIKIKVIAIKPSTTIIAMKVVCLLTMLVTVAGVLNPAGIGFSSWLTAELRLGAIRPIPRPVRVSTTVACPLSMVAKLPERVPLLMESRSEFMAKSSPSGVVPKIPRTAA
jgi:hypothetical protein